MSRQNWRRAILGVLTLVAVWLWWGNLQLFYTSNSVQPIPVSMERSTPIHSSRAAALKYLPPKTNPFFKGTVRAVSGDASTRPQKSVQQIPKRPSSDHALSGFVTETKVPQVIVIDPGKSSRILTIGDSINGWQLVRIHDNSVLFQYDNICDTLFLSPSK